MVAAPKRPARRKSNIQYNEQEASELSDDEPDSGSSPPPRKRARGRAGVSGSKAGKKGKAKEASTFLEMPLDVMFEVSEFLRVVAVEFERPVGFMTCRSSAASNQKIYCNCLEHPRPFVESS